MSNSYNTVPVVISQDMTSFFAGQTLQAQRFGLRVWKIALVATTTTNAGTVIITEPNSGIALYPPINVAASLATGATILNDNEPQLNPWRDFKVVGCTGTGTALWIWYRL